MPSMDEMFAIGHYESQDPTGMDDVNDAVTFEAWVDERVREQPMPPSSGSNDRYHLIEDMAAHKALELIQNGAMHPARIARAALRLVMRKYDRWYS